MTARPDLKHAYQCWRSAGGCWGKSAVPALSLARARIGLYYKVSPGVDKVMEAKQNKEYAGFGKRWIAAIIDGIIINIGASIIGFGLGLLYGMVGGTGEGGGVIGFVVGTILGWLYFAIQESSPKQATLGKQAMEIIVTDLDGKQISFGRATGRYFGKYLSGAVVMIGYIMAAFTEKKQALHDLIAGTLVVKRR